MICNSKYLYKIELVTASDVAEFNKIATKCPGNVYIVNGENGKKKLNAAYISQEWHGTRSTWKPISTATSISRSSSANNIAANNIAASNIAVNKNSPTHTITAIACAYDCRSCASNSPAWSFLKTGENAVCPTGMCSVFSVCLRRALSIRATFYRYYPCFTSFFVFSSLCSYLIHNSVLYLQ